MSSSCMRYAREFADLRKRMPEVGEPRVITVLMAKSRERYGIHALESVYSMLPAGGYEWVTNTGNENAAVHLRHAGRGCGARTMADLYAAFGVVQVAGVKGLLQARFTDTFSAFKSQLAEFVTYLRTGAPASLISARADGHHHRRDRKPKPRRARVQLKGVLS
ncbi:MAG: hypothetical protein R3C45_07060 [Phycisphaerales bacterium]